MTEAERRRDELQRRVAGIRAEIAQCVQELLVNDSLPKFVVAEELSAIGTGFNAACRSVAQDPRADAEAIALVGLLAFDNGDRDWSVPVLQDEIRRCGGSVLQAARRLATARLPGIDTLLLAALRQTQPDGFDISVGLLDVLRKMGAALPPAVRAALLASPHWQVRTAVAKFPVDEA